MKVRGVASITSVNVLTETAEKFTDALVAVQVMTVTGLVTAAVVQLGSALHRSAGPAWSSSSFQICTRTVLDEGADTCSESAGPKAASPALAFTVSAPETTDTSIAPVAADDGDAPSASPAMLTAVASEAMRRRRT